MERNKPEWISTEPRLWFEPFLQELKKRLGYALDISKYSQLLQWIRDEQEAGMFRWEQLYPVCRLLFLQDETHRPVFNQLFLEYVAFISQPEAAPDEEAPTVAIEDKEQFVPETVLKKEKIKEIDAPENGLDKELMLEEPPDEPELKPVPEAIGRYLNITIPGTAADNPVTLQEAPCSSFLFTDAYLPLTTREMVHGWRRLRKKLDYRQGTRIDVPETVRQVAKDGLFLTPVFKKEQVNSGHLLLILADRRGSMTPFHKLTDRLIETALKEGGHQEAMVCYFYNCPGTHVYRNRNLTDPVPLSELYAKMRPDRTNALIISDAGAARGNINEARVKMTTEFLYGSDAWPGCLHKAALFVSWLNPMPRHRWDNTTASLLSRDEYTPMYSVMDDGYGNFLNIIEKLMGR